jgi:hypothetical protein
MLSPSDTALPRCPLCSLLCPMGAEENAMGHVRSVYPADLGLDRQGACVRGVTAARLMDCGQRALRARRYGRAAAVDEAVAEAVAVLRDKEPTRTAIVVDVNRPLEGVAAVAEVCRRAGAHLAVFGPPEDLPLVDAGLLDPEGRPPLAGLSACDLVLAVGDPFSTHPAVAMPVRDMQFAARGNRLISVDAFPGRTTAEATESVVPGPQGLAAFLAALAVQCGADTTGWKLGGQTPRDICEGLGLPMDHVRTVAAALKEASSPGVLVSLSLGRCTAARAAAAAVRLLAAAVGAKLWSLTVSANSGALRRLEQVYGARPLAVLLGEAAAGELDVLMVAGWDPASVMAGATWRKLSETCATVCWAASLESPFDASADVVLPLKLAWEEAGTMVGPSGEPVLCAAWPAAGQSAMGLAELADRLAAGLGVGPLPEPDVGSLVSSGAAQAGPERSITADVLRPQPLSQGQVYVVGLPEPQGFTGGVSLGTGHWQRRVCAEERVAVPADLVRALGLGDGQTIDLTNGDTVSMPWRLQPGPHGVVGVPTHWPQLRELLQPEGAEDPLHFAARPVGAGNA